MRRTAIALLQEPRVLVIAHRGASKSAPENTVPAFEVAMAAGADLVEFDYRNTSDGVPVVMHDATYDRTTDVERVTGRLGVDVETTTSDLAAKLDAGRWFGADFALTGVPTVDGALEVIQRGSMALIERKAGNARDLVALLEKRGDIRHVVVQSFDWRFLRACRRLAPDLTVVALGNARIDEHRLALLRTLAPDGICWCKLKLDAEALGHLQGTGLPVWAYTVNDVEEARALVNLGVRGIVTDAPRELAEALGRPF